MGKKIKIGDLFICKKKVIMYSGEVEYRKGIIYKCEEDGCITDDANHKGHIWSSTSSYKDFKKHFVHIKPFQYSKILI